MGGGHPEEVGFAEHFVENHGVGKDEFEIGLACKGERPKHRFDGSVKS